MKADEVRTFIYNLLANRFGCNITDITDSNRLIDDLGADSLTLTDIMMAIEIEFHLSQTHALLIRSSQTVGQLIRQTTHAVLASG